MKRGFTMVELSLAIALIGVLSIIVLLMIRNAVSAYHKGMVLNQINTVGMGVVDDMRSALQSSPGRFSAASDCASVYNSADKASALNACTSSGASSFITIEKRGTVTMASGTKIQSAPLYGAFCTGSYSYIWNSGYYFNSTEYTNVSDGMASFTYKDVNGNTATKNQFKLLKVADDNRAVCKMAAGAVNGNYSSTPINAINLSCSGIDKPPTDICGAIDAETIETNLIEPNSGLALYDLAATRPAESTGTNNLFYNVSFILGTVQGGVNVMGGGNYCAAPEDYSNAAVENFDYCAINKFNFAAQATGG